MDKSNVDSFGIAQKQCGRNIRIFPVALLLSREERDREQRCRYRYLLSLGLNERFPRIIESVQMNYGRIEQECSKLWGGNFIACIYYHVQGWKWKHIDLFPSCCCIFLSSTCSESFGTHAVLGKPFRRQLHYGLVPIHRMTTVSRIDHHGSRLHSRSIVPQQSSLGDAVVHTLVGWL